MNNVKRFSRISFFLKLYLRKLNSLNKQRKLEGNCWEHWFYSASKKVGYSQESLWQSVFVLLPLSQSGPWGSITSLLLLTSFPPSLVWGNGNKRQIILVFYQSTQTCFIVIASARLCVCMHACVCANLLARLLAYFNPCLCLCRMQVCVWMHNILYPFAFIFLCKTWPGFFMRPVVCSSSVLELSLCAESHTPDSHWCLSSCFEQSNFLRHIATSRDPHFLTPSGDSAGRHAPDRKGAAWRTLISNATPPSPPFPPLLPTPLSPLLLWSISPPSPLWTPPAAVR